MFFFLNRINCINRTYWFNEFPIYRLITSSVCLCAWMCFATWVWPCGTYVRDNRGNTMNIWTLRFFVRCIRMSCSALTLTTVVFEAIKWALCVFFSRCIPFCQRVLLTTSRVPIIVCRFSIWLYDDDSIFCSSNALFGNYIKKAMTRRYLNFRSQKFVIRCSRAIERSKQNLRFMVFVSSV